MHYRASASNMMSAAATARTVLTCGESGQVMWSILCVFTAPQGDTRSLHAYQDAA